MEALVDAMKAVEQQKTTRVPECESFLRHLQQQLPSLLHPSQLHTDGALYVPIKGPCANVALKELATHSICHSGTVSPMDRCIRIGLTQDHTLHAVSLSRSCEYLKRIFH
jgi:hypothetical protein